METAMPENSPDRPGRWRSKLLALPSTSFGWASVALLVSFFAVAIIGQGLLEIDTRWVNVGCLLASAVAGLIALVFKRDRSWLVWIPVTFTLIVVGAEIVEGLSGVG